MRTFYQKYRHGLPALIYGVIYLIWFGILEQRQTRDYMHVHMNIDDYIPFCEVFVVPYLLWFGYVAVVFGYLFFKDRDGYWKYAIFLAVGMTIFLVLSTWIPNGHNLRLKHFPRENVFTWMISLLWKADTATNLFPSIHVYNSLAAHYAVLHNKALSEKRWVRCGSFILCVSIILSTVLIKQHSMFDVLTAFILAAVMYVPVYYFDAVTVWRYNHRYQPGRGARKRARIS